MVGLGQRVSVVLLILSMGVFGALDQSYVQTVTSGGDSVIVKDMDVSLYSDMLPPGTFTRMADICAKGFKVPCSVDSVNKTIMMEERIGSGAGYYTFNVEYGFPFTRYVLVMDRIPTDRFSSDLDALLVAANGTAAPGEAARPLELDKDNSKTAAAIRSMGASIRYSIKMPGGLEASPAGVVKDGVVEYDLVSLMERQGPLTVSSSEINIPYVIIVAAAIVVAALAFSFMGSSREKPKEAKPAPAKRKR